MTALGPSRPGAWSSARQVSSYIDRVEAGEIFTVTKRGKPVAQVSLRVPRQAWRSLLAEGRLRGSGAKPAAPKALPLQDEGKSAAEYVSEGRR